MTTTGTLRRRTVRALAAALATSFVAALGACFALALARGDAAAARFWVYPIFLIIVIGGIGSFW